MLLCGLRSHGTANLLSWDVFFLKEAPVSWACGLNLLLCSSPAAWALRSAELFYQIPHRPSSVGQIVHKRWWCLGGWRHLLMPAVLCTTKGKMWENWWLSCARGRISESLGWQNLRSARTCDLPTDGVRHRASPKYSNSLAWKSLVKGLPGNTCLGRIFPPSHAVECPVWEARFGVEPEEPGGVLSFASPRSQTFQLLHYKHFNFALK